MIDLDLNGEEPKHVKRLNPIIDVDSTGKVNWTPGLLDYDASKMYRGKQLTSEELNKLLLKQIYQGNYLTDSLKEFFDNQLGEAILSHFRSDYDLTSNYIKIFLSTDWGTEDEHGYCNIEIPASEHGFEIDESEDVLERMNIQVSMYLYKDGKFHEVQQYTIDDENTVTLYTDDTTAIGFVVIQDNNKAFSITEGNITIGQVTGLSSRLDGYGARITANENNIGGIRSGSLAVGHATLADEATHATDADNAENLTTKIRNINLDKIFETGSRNIKQATRALRLSELNANDSSETYAEAGSSTQPIYFSGGRPVAITGALANNITGNAATATEATHAASATNADNAEKATKDDLGRTIKETYSTGLNVSYENITVTMLVPANNTSDVSTALNQIRNGLLSTDANYTKIDLFRSSPTAFTIPAFMVRNIDGSIKKIVMATHLRGLQGTDRYDKKFLFLHIEGLNNVVDYPRAVAFTSTVYDYGSRRNVAERKAHLNLWTPVDNGFYIIGGTNFVRYDFFDTGYDFVTDRNVIIELLSA